MAEKKHPFQSFPNNTNTATTGHSQHNRMLLSNMNQQPQQQSQQSFPQQQPMFTIEQMQSMLQQLSQQQQQNQQQSPYMIMTQMPLHQAAPFFVQQQQPATVNPAPVASAMTSNSNSNINTDASNNNTNNNKSTNETFGWLEPTPMAAAQQQSNTNNMLNPFMLQLFQNTHPPQQLTGQLSTTQQHPTITTSNTTSNANPTTTTTTGTTNNNTLPSNSTGLFTLTSTVEPVGTNRRHSMDGLSNMEPDNVDYYKTMWDEEEEDRWWTHNAIPEKMNNKSKELPATGSTFSSSGSGSSSSQPGVGQQQQDSNNKRKYAWLTNDSIETTTSNTATNQQENNISTKASLHQQGNPSMTTLQQQQEPVQQTNQTLLTTVAKNSGIGSSSPMTWQHQQLLLQQRQEQQKMQQQQQSFKPESAAPVMSLEALKPNDVVDPQKFAFLLPSTLMPPSVLASVLKPKDATVCASSMNGEKSSLCTQTSTAAGSSNNKKRKTCSSSSSSTKKQSRNESPQQALDRILAMQGYGKCIRIPAENASYETSPSPLQLASFGTELVQAIHSSNVERLARLLEAGLSPNPCNKFRDSIVDLVCKRANAPIFQCLLDHGCDLRVCDGFGRTPLHHCCWASEFCPQIAEEIIRRDWQQLFIEDKRGQTPLEYVRPDQALDWIDFLEDNMDRFFPVGGSVPAVVCMKSQRPDGSLPDPPNALSVSLASAVSSGQMTLEELASLNRDPMHGFGS